MGWEMKVLECHLKEFGYYIHEGAWARDCYKWEKKGLYEVDHNMKNGFEWGGESSEIELWKECKKINEAGLSDRFNMGARET